jgi:hypothetical protein
MKGTLAMKRIVLGLFAMILLFAAGTYSVANRSGNAAPAPERDIQVTTESRNPWTNLRLNNDPDEFQFAIISDRTGGHRANIFAQAVERLNLMQPEFVLSVGDLIEGGRKPAEQIKAEWTELNAMIGKLQMKFFYAPGNHDVGIQDTAKYWEDTLGRRYYHFVYRNVLFLILNTEDPPNTGGFQLGHEQLAWAEKVLAQNRGVRWTIVSMHKPIWTRPDLEKTGLLRLEKALADRPYTVFVGHVHRFQKFVRNGRDYYQLATTGGGSKMRGVEEGEFDHFVWVTMKKEGPVLANILLDAVLPENLVQPVTNEKGTSYARYPARQPFDGKVFLDGAPIPGAVIEFHPTGEGQTRGARADGVAQPDGSFRLSTVTANDGVPVGQYTVTVTLRRPLFTPEGRPGKNTLPEQYARQTTSPLRATIVEGKNDVTLELRR